MHLSSNVAVNELKTDKGHPMKNLTAFLGLVLISSTVVAGSNTVDCSTKSKSIVFSVGNGSNAVQIKYVDASGKSQQVYDAPIQLMPEFDYGTEQNEKTVNAISVGNANVISKKNDVQKVYNKDGSLKCSGREFWDIRYTQKMVLTGKDNKPLNLINLLGDKKVVGMNNDGYITADFTCHAYGATTSGGCDVDGE